MQIYGPCPVFDPGASWRFGVPDLLDWNGHG
jgi:hypothetical protein